MSISQKIRDFIIGGIFAAAVLVISVSSFNKNHTAIFDCIKKINISNVTDTVDSLENTYKNGIENRNKYIDLYGVVQNALGKSMIGNFEYIKDKQGYIHKFIDGPLSNTKDFIDDMKIISAVAGEKGIRTVYVQNPYLTITENSGIDIYVNEIAGGGTELHDSILDAEIPSINMAEVFERNGYTPNECFMKTDGGHMTTSAEMLVAKELVSYMEESCGMVFDETAKSNALNMENYDVKYADFVGNFARSSGKYFVGTDKFELISPKFDTNLTVVDYSKGTYASGSFMEVIDNGYQNRDDVSEYTYWVTNYLKYPSNHYEITNNNVQSNNILLVMDSTAIRTAAILSLAAHRVTVIDPRYGSYESFIDAISKDSYDVVFVIQNYSLIYGEYGGLLPDGFSYAQSSSMQVVDCDIPSEMVSGETYNFSVTVRNTGSDKWNELSRIRLSIEVNGKDYARGYIENGNTVLPGEEYKFCVNDFQVSENENFIISFKMVQEGISYFAEDSKSIKISVKKN